MHGRLNVCQEALERKRAGEHLHVIARHYQVSRSTIFMLCLTGFRTLPRAYPISRTMNGPKAIDDMAPPSLPALRGVSLHRS
jgi:hypothetical protein